MGRKSVYSKPNPIPKATAYFESGPGSSFINRLHGESQFLAVRDLNHVQYFDTIEEARAYINETETQKGKV